MTRSVGGTHWHRRRQAWQPIVATGQLHCWRCNQPIHPGQPWDLGHLIDVIAGGTDTNTQPEHRTCNRAAGADITNARRRAARFSDANRVETPRALSVFPPNRWDRDW